MFKGLYMYLEYNYYFNKHYILMKIRLNKTWQYFKFQPAIYKSREK